MVIKHIITPHTKGQTYISLTGLGLSFFHYIKQLIIGGFNMAALKEVLVQKLQDNCNKSTNLGHTDTTNLKKVRDWYGKGKCIQMETFSV